jgi:hypothetical protein
VTIVCFWLCSWWWSRASWVGHMICQQANKRIGSVMVVNVDSHLVVMSPFCIGSLLDLYSDCLLLFYLCVVSTCVLICFVFLMDGFPSLIFYLQGFFLKTCYKNLNVELVTHFVGWVVYTLKIILSVETFLSCGWTPTRTWQNQVEWTSTHQCTTKDGW